MVLDAVSNFVRGSTDAAVDSTQTTIPVVDASIFPDPATDGEYNVVIWDVDQFPRPDEDPNVEVMRVTAIDTGANDLTVVRGQEGTTGAAHPSGSAVHLSPTAKMFSDIESTFADFWDAGAQELTGDVNNISVLTTQADVTGETFIRAERTTADTGNTAGTFVNCYDSSINDVNNELTSGVINVNNTGEYEMTGTIRIGGSTTAGDGLLIRVRNVTAGADANDSAVDISAPESAPFLNFSFAVDLTAGDDYEIQIVNFDSTFDVLAIGQAVIKKSVVHP